MSGVKTATKKENLKKAFSNGTAADIHFAEPHPRKRTFAACNEYKNCGSTIDESKRYARMAAAEIPTVTFAVKPDAPQRSRKNTNAKMRTPTIAVTPVT
ncbi:MAG: hypothetical protein RR216_06925 [Pseudoflavonifractor sp.]